MFISKIPVILCTSLSLAGCGYVYSETVVQGLVGNGSAVYALQDSIVDIRLAHPDEVDYQNISLVERTVADRGAQVAVSIQSNPVSEEILTVSVDRQSHLLKSVNSTVEGRLDEVVVEAGRSIGRLRGAGFLSDNAGGAAVETRTIASFRVGDPLELAAAASEFRRITGFGLTCLEGCTDVSVLPPAGAVPVIYYRTPATLRLGFCRGDCQMGASDLPPNLLTFRTVETFNSPNLVALPIRGSLFGRVVDNITFSDGVPETVTFNGASEALDIARVPGAFVGAIFAGLVSGSDDQASIINAETRLAEAEQARAAARQAAAEATIAEIEALERLNCARNPELCVVDTDPTGDRLPDGL